MSGNCTGACPMVLCWTDSILGKPWELYSFLEVTSQMEKDREATVGGGST